jgi:hypothetical protein
MSVRLFVFVALLVSLCDAYASDASPIQASDRALHFVLNMYSGIRMRSSEWLELDPASRAGLEAYGGLETMVRQSTAFAHAYGGVDMVRIESIQKLEPGFLIEVLVTFREDDRRRNNAAIAEREVITWRLQARQSGQRWRFSIR